MAGAHAAPPASRLSLNDRLSYAAYRAAAEIASRLPEGAANRVGRELARAAAPFLGKRGVMVAKNASRARGRALNPLEERQAVRAAVASYARYWVESLRLPAMDPAVVDARFSIEGLEHISAAREAGRGAVLALPHVGGWEVGGSWFVRRGFPLAVVVEPVRPPRLFEWFADLRRSFGFTVIPLGKDAFAGVMRALRENQVVALVTDRDIAGGGVEVDFFGEKTTLPAGPAICALRAGAPLLPTAVYFCGDGWHAVVRPPLPAERHGRLGDDAARLTQALAYELEDLIRAAPEQWHLFQPNWPSDQA